MASTDRIVKILFNAEDRTGKAFASVSDGLGGIQTRLEDISEPLARTSEAVLATGAAVGVMGAAFLGVAYRESVDFESALSNLGRVLDATEGDVRSYVPEIERIGEAYGTSATSVVDAAANFRQAGFDIQESLQLTDTALRAVAVSELEASEASNFFVSILKGFNLEASETVRILDVLNAQQNNYNTSVGELAQGLADVSPAARAAGLTLEETSALLTVIIEVYGSGSEAARALSTSLGRLSSDTRPVQQALEQLGVTQLDANGALRSSGDILRDLAQRWQDLSEPQRQYYANELVGLDQSNRFQLVLTNYNRVLESTAIAQQAAGSSLEELAVTQETARFQIDQTRVSFENLLRSIGDRYRAEMTGAIGATGELAQVFKGIVDSGGLAPLFDLLRPLLRDFEEDVRAIAQSLPEAFRGLDFGPVEQGFRNLGDAIADIFGGLDLTSPEGLEQALQQLINVGGGFLQVLSGIVEALTPFIQRLGDLGQRFGELDPRTQQATGNILGLGQALDALLSVVPSVGEGLGALGTGLTAIGGASALKTITGLTGGMQGLAAALGRTGVAGAAAGAGTAIGSVISDWIDRAIPGTETLGTALFALVNPAKAAGNALTESVTAADLVKLGYADVTEQAGKLAEATQEVADSNEGLIQSEAELKALTDTVTAAIEKQRQAAIDNASGILGTVSAIDGATGAVQDYIKTTDGLVRIIRDSEGAITGYEGVHHGIADATERTAETTRDATKASEEFRLKLEEIASNERIRNIELAVSLDIAELEAQTRQVEKAFESIDKTVESTGELLGTLFSAFDEAGRFTQLLIEDQIDQENRRRDEALRKQNELIDAQVRYMHERANALARGDAIIKVDGDGLQPHLEAFMWEIIDAVRVQANADGTEFLLGIGAGAGP